MGKLLHPMQAWGVGALMQACGAAHVTTGWPSASCSKGGSEHGITARHASPHYEQLPIRARPHLLGIGLFDGIGGLLVALSRLPVVVSGYVSEQRGVRCPGVDRV